VVGAPLRDNGRLYNTAVAIQGGRVRAVVPKSFLPNYREFYERRWFTPGSGVVGRTLDLAGQAVPFGTDILLRNLTGSGGDVAFTVGIEICEDVWTPAPPSTAQAMAGAEILLNLSASNITIGKSETRRLLCASQSARRSPPMSIRRPERARARRTWPGTAMSTSTRWETCWPRARGSRPGR
jgi:NAD+ synthase (glutamine-hydrolysing)